jgi:hypothetical protein
MTVPYANYGNPQSLNLYTYGKNNPTTFGDPDGHDPWDAIRNQLAKDVAEVVGTGVAIISALSSGAPPQMPSPFPPPGACSCSFQNNNQNKESKQNNNNSQSNNSQEQGRDAQGKFLPKKGGETAPGSAAEKEGLDSVGATKNTEKLNGTIRDGTVTETGDHVEIKSGASVNNTEQLQKMGQAAVDATGKPLKVVTTNPNVKVSQPAQQNENLQIEPMKKK